MALRIFLAGAVLMSIILTAYAQQCGLSQFAIRNENGEDYLTINSPTVVKTCGGINICDEISSGKQTLALSSNGAEILISNGNSVQLPDSSVTNEIQTLTLDSSGTLSISQGNQVTLGDNSPTNEIQTLNLDSAGRLSISQGNQVLIVDNSASNELQTLSLDSSGRLAISQGNEVLLTDNSVTNELQILSLDSTGKLSISQGNQVTLADNSPSNELQTLPLDSSGTLSISQGNQVTLADNSATNEIQNLALDSTGKLLSISQGNSIVLSDNNATNEIQTLKLDATGRLSISLGNEVLLSDNNATNELQNLSLDPSGVLSISQGNQVTLADNSNTNELQALSLAGTKLSISSQNTIDLAISPAGSRAAFSFLATSVAVSQGLGSIMSITVTPPDTGNILTRFCGSIQGPTAGLKGYTFGFSTNPNTLSNGRAGIFESMDGETWNHWCIEWWWPVSTPKTPMTIYVVAQAKVANCFVVTAQMSAVYYYGGI